MEDNYVIERKRLCHLCKVKTSTMSSHVKCGAAHGNGEVSYAYGKCPYNKWSAPPKKPLNTLHIQPKTQSKNKTRVLSKLDMYPPDQRAIINAHREACEQCEDALQVRLLTVDCDACDCKGVSFLLGRCTEGKWKDPKPESVEAESQNQSNKQNASTTQRVHRKSDAHDDDAPSSSTTPKLNRYQRIGHYKNGTNNAHVWSINHRQNMIDLFGCPMYGTFNIKLERDPIDPAPAIVDGEITYYLIQISLVDHPTRIVRGWYARWARGKLPKNSLEVFTKVRIPDEFRFHRLKIDLCDRWSEELSQKWIKKNPELHQDEYWPKTKPGDNIWMAIQDDYCGKSVLDLNAGLGYFPYTLSKEGARVTAITTPDLIKTAETINNHIECQDVVYLLRNTLPARHWDYILSLNSPLRTNLDFNQLISHVGYLRSHCNVAYLQTKGFDDGTKERDRLNQIIQGRELLMYDHPEYGSQIIHRLVS